MPLTRCSPGGPVAKPSGMGVVSGSLKNNEHFIAIRSRKKNKQTRKAESRSSILTTQCD